MSDPRMKILYSLPAIQISGGVVHFLQVAGGLARRGHEVTVQAPFIENLDLLPPLPDSVTVQKIEGVDSNLYTLPPEKRLPEFLKSIKDLTFGLRAIARQIPKGTEIIHAGFHPNAKAAVLARKKGWWNGRVLQATHMDPVDFLPESYKKRYAWLFKKTPYRVDHLITVCSVLEEKLGRYNLPVTNVLNGADPIYFRPEKNPAPDLDPNNTLLYCGAISRRKGIDTLLEAFAKTLETRPDATLVLTGRGSWDQYYKGYAERLGVLDRVRYLGQVPLATMPDLMDAATMFVFPTWWEGFGLPPLEAMARGLPVITTDNDGTREYVKREENCLLVTPGNSTELAGAINRLFEDEELRKKLRTAGPKTAAQFTWEEVTDRTEAAMLSEWEHLRTNYQDR